MADKEATVYIVDVGRSMGRKHQGRNETDFDWAMRYVWDKITTTVATGRKTLLIGVLGLKTDGTKNELAADESYAHITLFHPISQILMPDLRRLREVIKPSKTDQGDAVSAIVLAIHMIINQCKQLKYRRRIVLVTDGKGYIDSDPDSLNDIIKKINGDNMELVVLGVDFDDPEYGFKEEEKPPQKTENEAFLRDLTEKCHGVFGTMAQAVEELDIPRLKTIKPIHSYRGTLTLGDPKEYDTALSIDVERFPRTMIAKPPSASAFVLRSDGGEPTQSTGTMVADGEENEATQRNGNTLTNVRSAYSYTVADADAPGGKKDVARDDLAKGYEYGRTVVPISESDENITKLESEAGMEIVGFVPKDKYERYMAMGTSNIVVAQKTNDKAVIALSSLIHALFELDAYAVARVVKKDGSDPLLILLSPSVEKDYECLIENQLPFSEDVRSYRFPPIDKIITVSGKVVTQHRNLPTKDLSQAMSDFVDKMDISHFDRNDEGEAGEYMALEDTFSPVLHRIEQAKRWRAVRPMEPLPPVPEVLLKYSQQPEELQREAKPALQRLMKAADVKKVPPKVKGRKRNREADKPLSGLNVDDLFRQQPKRAKISPENSIPEFKQTLARAVDIEDIKDAVKQMAAIIENQIKDSFGNSNYDRVLEELGVMRSELTELEEPVLYNDLLRGLKMKIMAEELGGDRREMWWSIRRNRLSLIDKRMSAVSDVTEEEVMEFNAAK
ncbi:ATP-dependent DNA helicase II subunit 2 [Endocarpon pusillum]|uniref:ATP-dependent DNA helicase II subunit 2 n=1 Tax=Endocarpon pusillum TaxID=364733 RepID=A0A8H7E1V1_9EURO|nr:ATP-dependent DNA helicase II subunit 2 [Endocarpon pusillum]